MQRCIGMPAATVNSWASAAALRSPVCPSSVSLSSRHKLMQTSAKKEKQKSSGSTATSNSNTDSRISSRSSSQAPTPSTSSPASAPAPAPASVPAPTPSTASSESASAGGPVQKEWTSMGMKVVESTEGFDGPENQKDFFEGETFDAFGRFVERWFLPALAVLGLIAGGIGASGYNSDPDTFVVPATGPEESAKFIPADQVIAPPTK